jgi:hypothetical protein
MTTTSTSTTNQPVCPTCSDVSFLTDKETRIEWVKIKDLNDFADITSEDKHVALIGKSNISKVESYLQWRRKLPAHELDAWKYTRQMIEYIQTNKGEFLCDDVGEFHFILNGRCIPIKLTSLELQKFMVEVCNITGLSPAATMAVKRLEVEASKRCSKMTFRRFSAMYDGDAPRVYLPIADDNKLLCVTPKEIGVVMNGYNADHLWLQHPEGNPMQWAGTPSKEAVREGLRLFEQLIVETQACAVPEMRWFVAMAEGLFPLVRDVSKNRFITVHTGDKGSGKTTGAKSCTLLHGFEDVLLDVSVAALGNASEQGFVVVDNKEQANFSTALVDYFLSVATGGTRLRSASDRSVHRGAAKPVAVITTIEGVRKAELQDRCVDVKYFLAKDHARIDRDELEHKIIASRSHIMTSLAVVLQEYFSVRTDPAVKIGVSPIDRFNRHFRELCYLLIAFGRVMYGDGEGDVWAMKHVHIWDNEIRQTREAGSSDAPVSPYEDHILHVIGMCKGKRVPFKYNGRSGQLHIVYPGALLGELQRERVPIRDMPTDPGGLSNRLRGERFDRIAYLTKDSKDDDGNAIAGLSRTENGQPVGVFVPDGM